MLAVTRNKFTDQSTGGMLTVDMTFECFTLEPRKDQSQGKPFCIPAGLYDYQVMHSQHFGFDTVWILNVPGFEDIEIHPGNVPRDTHGCTIVGSIEGDDFVGHSVDAFRALMAKIPPRGQITYSELA